MGEGKSDLLLLLIYLIQHASALYFKNKQLGISCIFIVVGYSEKIKGDIVFFH